MTTDLEVQTDVEVHSASDHDTAAPALTLVTPRRINCGDPSCSSCLEACPWCDGRGQRWRTATELVFCNPCADTGYEDRWHGVAADDWRARRAWAPPPETAEEPTESPA